MEPGAEPHAKAHAQGDLEARDLVRELLADALRAQRGGHLPSESVRRQTRAVCACARTHGLPIERVLVTVKREWQEKTEARRLARFEASTVLERIVTLCITEFYAERGPERDGSS
jgi:hypothetical protein